MEVLSDMRRQLHSLVHGKVKVCIMQVRTSSYLFNLVLSNKLEVDRAPELRLMRLSMFRAGVFKY